jgi:molecular chaperone DnaK (HSP70)
VHELSDAFEVAKRNFDPAPADPVLVEIPNRVRRVLPASARQALSSAQDGIDQHIVLPREQMRQLFDAAVDNTLALVDKQLAETGADRLTVVLVGGFGRAGYLRQRLRDHLAGQAPLIVPEQPEHAVLRGAVRFAAEPGAIRQRRSRLTYGCGVTLPYDPMPTRTIRRSRSSLPSVSRCAGTASTRWSGPANRWPTTPSCRSCSPPRTGG